VVGYWHGYLSGARCRLAYGPADATATHCLLLHFNSYFPGKLGLASSPRFHHPVAQEDTFDDYITTL